MSGYKNRFVLNGTVTALCGIVLRTAAVSFNAYVASRVGREGMGLYTLIMSVYGFAVTLAASGVNLASVRLTAEAQADGISPSRIVRRTVAYALLFGSAAALLTGLSAPLVGRYLLGDARSVASLRVMSAGLPALSVSTALAGYFTGVGRAYKNAICGVLEQVSSFVFIILFLIILSPYGIEYSCLALVAGTVAAEVLSVAAAALLYAFDVKRKKSPRAGDRRHGIFRKIFGIAMPVAVGSCIRQGFTTAEHIAIPWGLRRNGADEAGALSAYGVMSGMALPVVLYPSVVIGAYASLLVPELAALAQKKKAREITRLSTSALFYAVAFSTGAAALFSFYGNELGQAIYSSPEAGKYITVLAPLVPLMFLDTTVDSILKGLGEQVYTMKVNIIDSVLCLVFVLVLVPRMGIDGYVVVIYVSEAINAALSIYRMQKVCGARVTPSLVLYPWLAAALAYALTRITETFLPALPVYASMCITCAAYAAITVFALRRRYSFTRVKSHSHRASSVIAGVQQS